MRETGGIHLPVHDTRTHEMDPVAGTRFCAIFVVVLPLVFGAVNLDTVYQAPDTIAGYFAVGSALTGGLEKCFRQKKQGPPALTERSHAPM